MATTEEISKEASRRWRLMGFVKWGFTQCVIDVVREGWEPVDELTELAHAASKSGFGPGILSSVLGFNAAQAMAKLMIEAGYKK